MFVPFYHIFWFCSVQNQIKNRTGRGFGGVGHFFMYLFFGWIYGPIWYFSIAGRIGFAGGRKRSLIGWLYLLGIIGGAVLVFIGLSMWMVELTDFIEYFADWIEAGGDAEFTATISFGLGFWLMWIGAMLSGVMQYVLVGLIQSDMNTIPNMSPQPMMQQPANNLQ